MKNHILFCLLLAMAPAFAQNLVPNPGFDIQSGCPNQIGQIYHADGWSVWGGTADYFHSCANAANPIFGTPNNNRGYRTPRSGDAYIGLFTHSIFMPNGREFVGRALASPLNPGTTYYVSMYVCMADVAVLGHSTNNIGIRFSTVPFSLVQPDTALNNAHVWSSSVINDSINWVRVSGIFIADSAYTHIGIGNYFSDSASTIVPGGSGSNYAYYLIDDICVSEEMSTCGFIPTSDEEESGPLFRVYPNPSSGIFFLEIPEYRGEPISVFDVYGRLLMQQRPQPSRHERYTLNLGELENGLYTIVSEGRARSILLQR